MRKNQKSDAEEMKPIIFQNKPIEEENKDLFDFSYQKKVLSTAIESNARIIGIVGDYGTGKSSITKLLEKDRRNNKDKIININLWGQISKKRNGTGEDDENITNNSLIKSFLYQLAFANDKRNASFSKYINARLSKNNGKLGIAFSTKKVWGWLVLSAFCFVIFLTFNSFDSQTFDFSKLTDCASKWQKCMEFIFYSRYFIGALGVVFVIVATIFATPVFSSWKSEGNRNPDDSDIYDIYFKIASRLCRKNKKRCIIFIDDLDRTSEKELVVSFLKEIYKCVHLLPDEMQRQLVFVISLKAESQLNLDNETQDKQSPDFIYSKIFDYTLNIKQIHNENYREVVSELLEQEKESICALENRARKCNDAEDKILINILSDLKWIYSDENVTIRELKERLNESFLLYQTLLERSYENPSIELKKCAAVTFLKRKFEADYNKILLNEKEFAKLIRDCNKQNTENEISSIIDKSAVFKVSGGEQSKGNTNEDIKANIKEMIISRVLEDDFSMYLYSYPKNSYIKTVAEKELFDALIHNDQSYLNDENAVESIDDIINKKSGKVIDDAINKYLQASVPAIVYNNESLFKYVIEKSTQQRKTIFDELKKEIENFLTGNTTSVARVFNALKFSFNDKIKGDLEQTLKNSAMEKFKALTGKNIASSSKNIDFYREKILSAFNEFSLLFLPVFIDDALPLLSKDFFNNISYVKIKEQIIKHLSDTMLQKIDQSGINILDCNCEEYLLNKKTIVSLLCSYTVQDRLNEFDFSQDWISSELVKCAPKLLELAGSEGFIKIRKTAKSNVKEYSKDFYKLYNDDFPLITESELADLKIDEIYDFVNKKKITIENCGMLITYCNKNQLQADDLFLFIKSLFMDEYRISNPEIIRKIITSIDFSVIKFASLSEDQRKEIISFSSFKTIFGLNTVKGAFEFMRTVKCLIEELEGNFSEDIKKDEKLFIEYLELLNTLKIASKTTLEIIKDKSIKMALEPAITDYLYENKYYIEYIIGKTLYDERLEYNNEIPLERYYTVFKTSDVCLKYFSDNEIIDKFYNEKLYLDDKTPANRYTVFYKKRQPFELIKMILSKLNDNEEEQKKYLGQITDIDTENDAHDFIDFITTEKYLELLKDSNLFYYLWHKMWDKDQKAKFTKTVNQLLGTAYNAGEANDI